MSRQPGKYSVESFTLRAQGLHSKSRKREHLQSPNEIVFLYLAKVKMYIHVCVCVCIYYIIYVTIFAGEIQHDFIHKVFTSPDVDTVYIACHMTTLSYLRITLCSIHYLPPHPVHGLVPFALDGQLPNDVLRAEDRFQIQP